MKRKPFVFIHRSALEDTLVKDEDEAEVRGGRTDAGGWAVNKWREVRGGGGGARGKGRKMSKKADRWY